MMKNSWKKASVLFIAGMVLSACGTDNTIDEPLDEEEVVAPDVDENVTDDGTNDDDTNDSDEDSNGETNQVSQDIETWFPRLENTLLEYEGDEMEYSSFTRYPQFAHDDTLQMLESTGGTDVAIIYEYTENQIEEVFIRPETYFREDFVDTGLESEHSGFNIILQAPIEVGHSWESPNGTTSEITEVGIEMDTPMGTVEAIGVTTIFEDGIEVSYYGEGIGLIQREMVQGDDEETKVTSRLTAFEGNKAEEIPLTVYGVDDQALGINAVPVTMSLMTNDPARLTLASLMRGESPETEGLYLLTEGVEINYMYLGHDGIVHVDFSSELVNEMNAGSGTEGLLLQSIANTIGGYYGVQEIALTVDGGSYESGHILLEEGDTLTVDHSNVNQ
ncbi:GerMN domain-containing protein [Alkalibacterium sp. MB6]|uniref:GerMN domain-containing protein n=1 Tax=Alkalibacterium sp. MB6 TaxID=2081965 RepID=UPI001379C789|nr:GerMN domain-containing protein [Alkalibacterium sp. MB6]